VRVHYNASKNTYPLVFKCNPLFYAQTLRLRHSNY
jgi:hypothetical protein